MIPSTIQMGATARLAYSVTTNSGKRQRIFGKGREIRVLAIQTDRSAALVSARLGSPSAWGSTFQVTELEVL